MLHLHCMFNPIILEKSCNSRTLEIPKFSELYIVNERFCFGDKKFFLNVKKRISQEYGRWSDGISCCDDWREFEFKSRFRNSFWSGETHISVAAANVVDHNILFCVDRHTYLCSKICQCVDLFFFLFYACRCPKWSDQSLTCNFCTYMYVLQTM